MKTAKELIITELKKKGADFKKDYYSLNYSLKEELRRYAKQIKYKQTQTSKAMGRSYILSFYLSLQRLANKK